MWGIGAGAAMLVLNALLGGRLLSATAGAVARAPGDIFVGGVEGLTGLPDTRTADSQNKCQAAIDAGDDLAASFYCPAGTWWGGVLDGR